MRQWNQISLAQCQASSDSKNNTRALLFLLYVNDTIKFYNPNTEILQYAEDTLIFAADNIPSTTREIIETQIERLCNVGKNKLQLIALKAEFVLFSKHANPGNLKMSIKVGEERIYASKSMEYLRKSMECDMSSQSQNKTMLKNVAISMRTLHQIRKNLPSTTD